MRGDLRRLPADLPGRDMHRRAGVHGDAAAESTDAELDPGGIRRDHRDVRHVHAERVGTDLREHRAMALALRRGAGLDDDLAVGADAPFAALEGTEAGDFDAVADTDADMEALLPRRRLPLPEAVITRKVQPLRLTGRVVAAVVDA